MLLLPRAAGEEERPGGRDNSRPEPPPGLGDARPVDVASCGRLGVRLRGWVLGTANMWWCLRSFQLPLGSVAGYAR